VKPVSHRQGMHPTSAWSPRGPGPTRTGVRRRRTSRTLLTALACLAALGCLTGLVIARLPGPPARTTARSAVTPALAAGSATPGQPRLGAVSWPAGGVSAAGISGDGVTDGPGATRPVPVASVAKLMTAYVILRDHPLSPGGSGPDITVEPAEAADYPSQLADGDSLVAVAAGETLTERQALEALLLPSADNMAWILARWDAGGRAAFAARMNAAARGLAMTGTDYTDPSGLDPSTISTAADQVRLGMASMHVPALAAITAESTAVVPVAGLVRNTDTLLGQDGIVGLKTGSTAAAGGCLLVAAWQQVNGHATLIVAAVFGQPGTAATILPNALGAGRQLVLALDTALDPGARPRSADDTEGPPQRSRQPRDHPQDPPVLATAGAHDNA
jgi:serine-type D-Ala-D-Ala carboxypeptidase (penicillin-binding protein 5/6)